MFIRLGNIVINKKEIINVTLQTIPVAVCIIYHGYRSTVNHEVLYSTLEEAQSEYERIFQELTDIGESKQTKDTIVITNGESTYVINKSKLYNETFVQVKKRYDMGNWLEIIINNDKNFIICNTREEADKLFEELSVNNIQT